VDWLLQNLQGRGYAQPTPIQRQAIPTLMAGRELLAVAPTGVCVCICVHPHSWQAGSCWLSRPRVRACVCVCVCTEAVIEGTLLHLLPAPFQRGHFHQTYI
jgi:hypothetical protein